MVISYDHLLPIYGSGNNYDRLSFSEHPGAGGIRFQLPKRQKMQQQQNDFNPQKQARFMGPRPPRAPMDFSESQQQSQKPTSPEQTNGNKDEKNNNTQATAVK